MDLGLTREILGRYTLWQSEDCFKLGQDSVRLGAFASLRRGDRVCDLGCGVGTLLLLLSEREGDITRFGVELDPRAAELARRNLLENQLEGTILTGDLRTPALFPRARFDLLVANPPYFAKGTGKSGGNARMEDTLSLTELCARAGELLGAGGRFALVFRPERLTALFAACTAVGLEPKRLQFLAHSGDKPPYAVLVEAGKGAKAGLQVLPTRTT
jgi:tRNA1(Val) A37 N6-methylase TrmN6